jgi:O-antigen/teichoic acid export membrane protein
MDAAKRVALNTIFLYIKMLISMIISLISTRLILGALGIEDYGIFSLIAGIIAMLSFLNAAMTMSTQRFLSYYLGAGQIDKQKAIFNNSVALHLMIGVFVILLFEIAGLFLFNGVLNIPENRIYEAKIIFQFMIVSTFFTINSVPYDASINAHENMLFESIVGIGESIGKLAIAISLINSINDRLLQYGLLFALLTVIIRVIKGSYCVIRYEECRSGLRIIIDKSIFKEMFAFAGWNLLASFCSVIKMQGLAIIMNFYHGVIVNAAYGVANQVNGQLNAFSSNINKSFKPQIVKSEGAGDRPRMLRLAMLSCKLAFFLISLFAVPLILEMKYVLDLWLTDVPEYAMIFCQIILISSMIQQITWGLGIAVQSVGKIMYYQIIMAALLIMNLPMAIIVMKFGYSVYSVLAGSAIIDVFASFLTIYFANRLAGLSLKTFAKEIIMKPFMIILVASFLGYLHTMFFQESLERVLITSIITTSIIFILGGKFAMSRTENQKIRELLITFTLGFRNIFRSQ